MPKNVQQQKENYAVRSSADSTSSTLEKQPESTESPAETTVLTGGGEPFVLYDRGSGQTLTVSQQDYVRGALAAELPPTFHPEALKAQAVAAHTYALYRKAFQSETQDPALHGADLSVDIADWKTYVTQEVFWERYGDLAEAYWQTICDAADAVLPYLVTYEGQPALTAYCSMSNGQTEDAAQVWMAAVPYLTPVESFGDTLAPDYETTQFFTTQQLQTALQSVWPQLRLDGDPSGWLEIQSYSDSGYVTQVRAGDQQLEGKQLREALGLRSSCFDILWQGDGFSFTVRGYGHGVGLSQYGADYLARQGSTFDEILNHYYPGTQLGIQTE